MEQGNHQAIDPTLFSGCTDNVVRGGDGFSSDRDFDEGNSSSDSEEESSRSSSHWESSGQEEYSESGSSDDDVMGGIRALIGDGASSEEEPSDFEV